MYSQDLINSLPKTAQKALISGKISLAQAKTYQKNNIKECEEFDGFGLKIAQLKMIKRNTHNPLLKTKIENMIKKEIESFKRIDEANRLNLEKLAKYKQNALGMPLRKLIKRMHELAYELNDELAYFLHILLKTEFTNLSAKTYKDHLLIKRIYKYKIELLEDVVGTAQNLGIHYGVSPKPGKRACFLFMLYLPGDIQICWHCNELNFIEGLPKINDNWDEQIAMTLEKMIKFIDTHYGSYLHAEQNIIKSTAS